MKKENKYNPIKTKPMKKQIEKNKDKSEFGEGFVYNLVLFAKHWQYMEEEKDYYKNRGELNRFYSMWFNGASDHFYGIKVPKIFKRTKIERMTKELRNLSLDLGHGNGLVRDIATEKDYQKALELTEQIAFEIDKFFKVEPIEAEWK